MPIPIRPSPIPVALEPRATARRVGLITLGTDHTVEPDFHRLLARDGVALHVTRIPYANPVTPETLAAMEPHLTAAAALILPDEPLDALCFACTSATVVIGEAAVATALQAAKPGVPVVTPPTAAAAALRALGTRRISVLAPYTARTSAPMAAWLAARGFGIDRFTCLGLEDDREMARIDRATMLAAARDALAPASDALFISCTALRAAAIAAEIETHIGRPVVTSNQAAAWACLNHCGVAPDRPAAGRLMALPMAESA